MLCRYGSYAVLRLPMKCIYEPTASSFPSKCEFEVLPFSDRQRHGISIQLVTCTVDFPLSRDTPGICSQHINV